MRVFDKDPKQFKALCIKADSELFRLGESYEIAKFDPVWTTVHVKTGNHFDDILICGYFGDSIGLCGAKVENDDNIYVFELCERRIYESNRH
uniref:Uncharacterized protein n=1 Tax=Salmonella phage vB_SEnST11_KE22 TaxID=3161173 RepID=A0AAU8GEB4_9CAUD